MRFRCSVPAYDRIIDPCNFSSSSSVRFASDLAREIRERNPFRVGGRFLPPVADSRVARFGSLIEFRINYHGERESLLIITAIARKRNRGKDIFLEYRIESPILSFRVEKIEIFMLAIRVIKSSILITLRNKRVIVNLGRENRLWKQAMEVDEKV